MALRVWLPLNGDLHNQGLDGGVTVTNTGATVNSAGKIGSCYYFNGTGASVGNTLYAPNFSLSNIFSVSGWFKIVSSISSGSAEYLMCLNNNNYSGDMQFAIAHRSMGLFVIVNNTEYTIQTLTANTWYHISLTFNGQTAKVYINGVQVNSRNITSNPYVGSVLNIGSRSSSANGSFHSYYSKMYCNDIRIYDHCLSPKEVKEISKGLVVHYKLDQAINPNLLPASSIRNTVDGYTSSSEYMTICETKNIFDTYGLVPYTISFDIKAAVAHSFNIYGNPGTNPKYTFTSKTINVATEWQHITYTFTPRISTETGTWARVAVYGTYGSGAIVSVRRVKLELGSIETPLNGDSTLIEDVSGYGHNGSIVGSLSVSTDSPRYGRCLTFSNSNYVAAGKGGKVTDAITVAWWGYMSDWNTYGRAISCTEAGGWNFEPYSSRMRFSVNINGTYTLCSDTSTLTQIGAGWHHFVGTYDREKVKIYRDGEYIAETAAATSADIKYYANNGIFIGAEAGGNTTTGQTPYFNGKLSDIRIYATALSADDILELYNTAAVIDDGGNMNGYEFEEDSFNIITLENYGILKKQWLGGLTRYQQSHCTETLTDDGYRIFRDPNLTVANDGNCMYGGLVLDNTDNRFGLQKNHRYMIQFEVKGKSSAAASNIYWANLVGWNGGGLTPSPSNIVNFNPVSTNFNNNDWQTYTYKWTINDDIYKVCTSSYYNFVQGETYLSYKGFLYGFSYGNTGELGSDIYIKNIRMFDITNGETACIFRTGEVNMNDYIEGDQTNILTGGTTICNKLIEI